MDARQGSVAPGGSGAQATGLGWPSRRRGLRRPGPGAPVPVTARLLLRWGLAVEVSISAPTTGAIRIDDMSCLPVIYLRSSDGVCHFLLGRRGLAFPARAMELTACCARCFVRAAQFRPAACRNVRAMIW